MIPTCGPNDKMMFPIKAIIAKIASSCPPGNRNLIENEDSLTITYNVRDASAPNAILTRNLEESGNIITRNEIVPTNAPHKRAPK
jgi:hypothetical protein